MAAHNEAATWSMNLLTGSPVLISLMATVASLPFFLFTLVAGVIADKVNRQKLVCAINVWLAAMAAGLAVLAWLHVLNPYLILASVFLLGVGFAFNTPAWTSIVSEVVSDGEFPSAATLNGLQLNISGNYRSGASWFPDSVGRSEFCFCCQCILFSLGCAGNLPLEASDCTDKASFGDFCQIFRDGHLLRASHAGASGRLGPKFPVCSFHFGDSGVDSGCWLASIAPEFDTARVFVY